MLKVFNKDPHFMRDAVIVDSYEAAWEILSQSEKYKCIYDIILTSSYVKI